MADDIVFDLDGGEFKFYKAWIYDGITGEHLATVHPEDGIERDGHCSFEWNSSGVLTLEFEEIGGSDG